MYRDLGTHLKKNLGGINYASKLHFLGLFSSFSKLFTVNKCSIQFADGWNKTRVLWCWK